jgi:hypothetical protein
MNFFKRILGGDTSGSVSEENKAILCRMAEDGDDLSEPREIDFNHRFESQGDATAFADALVEKGYLRADCDSWDGHRQWQTTTHVFMVPDLAEISRTEVALDEIAHDFGGKNDGWGCMEVVEPEML